MTEVLDEISIRFLFFVIGIMLILLQIFFNIDGELTRGGTNDDEQTEMAGDTDSQVQTNPDGERINLPFLCILMFKAPTTFYQFFISKSSRFFLLIKSCK